MENKILAASIGILIILAYTLLIISVDKSLRVEENFEKAVVLSYK